MPALSMTTDEKKGDKKRHFYIGQLRHYHIGITNTKFSLTNTIEAVTSELKYQSIIWTYIEQRHLFIFYIMREFKNSSAFILWFSREMQY